MPQGMPSRCKDTDAASAALVTDLAQRGPQATIPQCLGVHHTKLTGKFQSHYFRLTDVHGSLVKQALAAG